jgi:hypothetical protein
MMVLVIGRTEGHYEAQEVPFGKVYAWRSGRVVIECDCRAVMSFTYSVTVCGCGTDHAAAIQEELDARRLGDEEIHPWRYVGDREDIGIPC